MSSIAFKAVATPDRVASRATPYGELYSVGLLAMADLMVVAAAFGTSVALWSAVRTDVQPALYLARWPVLFLFITVYVAAGLYRSVGLNIVEELRLSTIATTLAFLTLATGAFLLKEGQAYSRAVTLLAWAQVVIYLPVARSMLRSVCAHHSWWGRRAVILGAGKTGETLLRVLQKSPDFGLKPVALLDDDAERRKVVRGVPVLGGFECATAIVKEMSIQYGIIAMPELSREKLLEIIGKYGGVFPRLLVIPNLFGVSSLWAEATDIGGVLGIELRQKLLLPWARVVKRFLDIVLAMGIGIVSLPLIMLTGCLIKLTSKGPIFYSQMRVGEGGQTFKAWKFRTMVENADVIFAVKLNGCPELLREWTHKHKLRDDPRVSTIGRWLRRMSLDELPQLWNVLQGQMSVVGPRPIVQAEIARYGAAFELYCKVKPGMSGLWQVSGRNNTTYEERVHCDEYYVRNWSPWLDLCILGKTVKAVITGDGAY